MHTTAFAFLHMRIQYISLGNIQSYSVIYPCPICVYVLAQSVYMSLHIWLSKKGALLHSGWGGFILCDCSHKPLLRWETLPAADQNRICSIVKAVACFNKESGTVCQRPHAWLNAASTYINVACKTEFVLSMNLHTYVPSIILSRACCRQLMRLLITNLQIPF